jgi:sugar phosphate isomerase/epimerase
MKAILTNVTYHAVFDASILDALRYAQAHGFAGVQVAVEAPHLRFDLLTKEARAEIAAFRKANDLTLSLHGPDDVAPLFESHPGLVEGIFNYFDDLFSFAEEVGASIITFHPGAMAQWGTDTSPRVPRPEEDEELYTQAFKSNLDRLINLAGARFTLCIENYKLEPLLRDAIQEELDAGRLALCWDLPKTYLKNREPDPVLEQYFWDNLTHVRQVHLHDLRPGQSHCVLGTGSVDFMHFLPRLAAANVAEYCIEVRPREKALESLQALREMVGRTHETPST